MIPLVLLSFGLYLTSANLSGGCCEELGLAKYENEVMKREIDNLKPFRNKVILDVMKECSVSQVSHNGAFNTFHTGMKRCMSSKGISSNKIGDFESIKNNELLRLFIKSIKSSDGERILMRDIHLDRSHLDLIRHTLINERYEQCIKEIRMDNVTVESFDSLNHVIQPLSNLENLQLLNLKAKTGGNLFKDVNITNLSQLHLEAFNFSLEQFLHVNTIIKRNASISVLKVIKCDLNYLKFNDIIWSIGESIKEIDISGNPLNDKILLVINNLLDRNLKSLNTLKISKSGVAAEVWQKLVLVCSSADPSISVLDK